jgi:hypothetical protein
LLAFGGPDNCITITLQPIESKVGALTGERISSLAFAGLSELTPDIFCTDCVKAVINVISELEEWHLPEPGRADLRRWLY